MQTFRRIGLSALFLVSVGAAPCHGAIITLDAVDSGTYQASGLHNPGIENYLTGVFRQEHRSFVLFDLSSLDGQIQSATLRLFNPEVSEFLHGYVSPDPTETLNIYDVDDVCIGDYRKYRRGRRLRRPRIGCALRQSRRERGRQRVRR